MTEEIIERLQTKVKAVCPENAKVFINKLSNQASCELCLLTIENDYPVRDIDEWAIDEIYPQLSAVRNILNQESLTDKVRLLFLNNSYFVLYAPQDDGILDQFEELYFQECYGSEEQRHLVGATYKADELVAYLTKMRRNF